MSDSNLTKNALAASMKKLMREKPFDKISVSDICIDCGINRKSFYYHFRDKYELVNWIFYVGFIGNLDLSQYSTPDELMLDMCEYFYKERVFYKSALQIKGQNSFRDYLTETVTPICKFYLTDVFPEGDQSFCITFVIDALLNSLVRWLTGGYKEEMDAKEFTRRIGVIVDSIASHKDKLI